MTNIEQELNKRLEYPYRWGYKQFDSYDKKTKFIYKIKTFKTLLVRIDRFSDDLKNYAMNRWYNFWSAKATENMFVQNAKVKAHSDKYNKYCDFYIEGVPFDLKASVMPRSMIKPLSYYYQNSFKVINWLYNNQSSQQRQHFKNRLFLIFCDQENGEHWKMKANLSAIKSKVDKYLNNFDRCNLTTFDKKNSIVNSDIIWVTK